MHPLRVCLWFVVVLALSASTAAYGFQLLEKREQLPEAGERTVSVLRSRDLDFTFLCPTDWVMAADAGNEKIVFRSRDFAVRLVMQIRTGHSAARFPISAAELRKQVLDQIPGATIVEESKCYAGNLAGQAFDVRQQSPDRAITCCRMAFVPFSGGCVEFTLSSSPVGWPTAMAVFGSFLTSFNVDPISPSSP